jgi:hypothetical protein
LSAYNAAGQLIARYTTGALGSGKQELMKIARPTPDIAYVIAGGHAGQEVVLDTLTWGPGASATTNIQGAWRLPYLEGGTYRVKVTPPGGHIVTTPSSGMYTVGIAAGQSMGDLNFGLHLFSNIWHNLANAANVNGDPLGKVNVLDLLAVINRITSQGLDTQLPPTGEVQAIGYVDVDNNGLCNVLDLLAVINHITLQFAMGGGGGSGGSGEGPGSGLLAGSESGGQGEGEQSGAMTAAEYFAAQPLHVLAIPGDDADHDHAEHDHSLVETTADSTLTAAGAAILLLIGQEQPADLESPSDDAVILQSPPTGTAAPLLVFSASSQPALPSQSIRRTKLDEAIDLLAEDVAESLTGRRLARRTLRR